MNVAISLVVLVAVVITVAGLARRFDLSAPLVLVAVGIVGSFLPFVPVTQLSAEVVLVGLLPPLLYSAALQTSLIDFNANRRPILLMSIGLVAFTAAGVAVVVHLVLPDITWPAAFAIGAVVAPPDAVAASAIGRRIGMPRRLVTILEGESLLNDATALVALRTAILAAAGAATFGGVAWDFAVAAVGGVLTGVLTFAVVGWVRRSFTDPVFDTCVSFVTPFAAYVLAEQLHASGVVAIVVAGLLLGHRAPVLQTASSRIAERLNWRTVSFLLENTVFLLIGLQARWILEDVAESDLPTAVVVGSCAAALVAVMALRLAWVFPVRFLLVGKRAGSDSADEFPWTYAAVLGWAGMRGVVTLAAAFAIPPDFPHREVLVLIALTVTAGTLFIQGLSLPWLVARLRVPAPDPREDSLARAVLMQKASAAGIAAMEQHVGDSDPHGTLELLRQRAEQRDFAAWERLGSTDADAETPSEAYARLRREMLQVERGVVLHVRSTGRIPHEVVEEVLTALDVEESMIDVRVRGRETGKEAQVLERSSVGVRRSCEHLRDAAEDVEANTPGGCEDCLAEGSTWVHLRLCLDCGHVGCCDSSPRRHASAHFRATGHPVVRSGEPDEDWRWCFVDKLLG